MEILISQKEETVPWTRNRGRKNKQIKKYERKILEIKQRNASRRERKTRVTRYVIYTSLPVHVELGVRLMLRVEEVN